MTSNAKSRKCIAQPKLTRVTHMTTCPTTFETVQEFS